MSRTTPTADPVVTPELIKRHGLTSEEFERIKKILGREPNFTELGIFSVMWSEHCSYKNSRKELRKFPTSGPNILVKAGEENAGVVDIGDDWAIAFRIDIHNSRQTAASSPASSPALRITATASAYRPLVAKFISTKVSRAIRL